MANTFITMNADMYRSITGDLIRETVDRDIIEEVEPPMSIRGPVDREIIVEVDMQASIPTISEESGDEENEEDMYLARIGYQREEKKEPESKPLAYTPRHLYNEIPLPVWVRENKPRGLERNRQESIERLMHGVYEVLVRSMMDRNTAHTKEGIERMLAWAVKNNMIDGFLVDFDFPSWRYKVVLTKQECRLSFIMSDPLW